MCICTNYIRTERSPTTTFPFANDLRSQCPCTIRLHGKLYRCERKRHDHGGVHDAMCTGGDGYLVRW
jgi:hypothetical protein